MADLQGDVNEITHIMLVFFNTHLSSRIICLSIINTSLGTPSALKRSPSQSGHLLRLSEGKNTNASQWIQPFNFKQVAPLRSNMFFSVRLALEKTSTFKNGVIARSVESNVFVLQLVSRCTLRSACQRASPSSLSDLSSDEHDC